jgi:hypothetical protein
MSSQPSSAANVAENASSPTKTGNYDCSNLLKNIEQITFH